MNRKNLGKVAWVITVSTFASIIGSVSVNAVEYSDITDSTNKAIIDELSDYGIVKGINALQFAGDMKVQRQQMALFISRAITGHTDDVFDTTGSFSFRDVSDLTYLSAIIYCQSNGIITGLDEFTFNPTGFITYQDALVMICRAWGMRGLAGLEYPNAYIEFAEKNGLTKGIEGIGYTEEINRYTAARLVYNLIYSKSYSNMITKTPLEDGTYKRSNYSSNTLILNAEFGAIDGKYIITANDENSINGEVAGSDCVKVSRIWEDTNGYINGAFDDSVEVPYDMLNIDVEYSKCVGAEVRIFGKNDMSEIYKTELLSEYDVYTNRGTKIGMTRNTVTINGTVYNVVRNYSKKTVVTGRNKTNEIIIYNGNRKIDTADLNEMMESNEYEIVVMIDKKTGTARAVVREFNIGQYSVSNGYVYMGQKRLGKEREVNIRSTYKLYNGDYVRYSWDKESDTLSIDLKYDIVEGTVTKIVGTSVLIDGTEYKVADNRRDLVSGRNGIREQMKYKFIVNGRKIVGLAKEVENTVNTGSGKSDDEEVLVKTEFDNDGYFVPVLDVNYDLYKSLTIKDNILARINEYTETGYWGYVGDYLKGFVSTGNISWDIIKNADRYDESMYLDYIIANLIYRTDSITSEVLKNCETDRYYRTKLLNKADTVLRTTSSGSITKVSEASSDILKALYSLMDPNGQLGEISPMNNMWKDYVVALNDMANSGVDMSGCVQVVFGYFDGMPAIGGLTSVDKKNSYWYNEYKVDNYELYRYTKNDDSTLKAYRLTDDNNSVIYENNKKNVYSSIGGKVVYSEQQMKFTRVSGRATERGLIIQRDSTGRIRFNSELLDSPTERGVAVKGSYVITDNTSMFINQRGDMTCVNGAKISDLILEDKAWIDMTLIMNDDNVVVAIYIDSAGISRVTQNITYDNEKENENPTHVYLTSMVATLDGGGYMYEGLKFTGTKTEGTSYVYSESKLSIGTAYKVTPDSEKGTVLLVDGEINYTYAEVQSVNTDYMIVKVNGEQQIIKKERIMDVWKVNFSDGENALKQVDMSYIEYGAVIAFPCDDISSATINSVIIIALS